MGGPVCADPVGPDAAMGSATPAPAGSRAASLVDRKTATAPASCGDPALLRGSLLRGDRADAADQAVERAFAPAIWTEATAGADGSRLGRRLTDLTPMGIADCAQGWAA